MLVAPAGLAVHVEPMWHDQGQLILGTGQGTYSRRRSSPISLTLPVDMSEGMQPSTTLSANTDFHSWPLANGWLTGSGSPSPAAVCPPRRRLHCVDQGSDRQELSA